PGSDWGCQMWGFEQCAEVADHLIERWNARLMITGLASERWMADRIANSMRNEPAIASGETSLTELTALVGRFDLLVGVDSGPVTLGVAVGTPVVALDGWYYS